jgi:ABC-type glycerol-3-phosphate transport system substrate-binding protein
MKAGQSRKALGLVLVASVALTTAAACGSNKSDNSGDAGGVVTITVNSEPPATEVENRKFYLADVAEFEKSHPTIKIVPHEGKMDPATFSSRLAGGQLEDVFYVYFTDPAGLIAKKQVADVTQYAKDDATVKQINPDIMKTFQDKAGHIYGVPWTNYTMGLLYNRTLFKQAGLDPETPPATWADVRADAKKIAALGNGTIGYGDYSKSNTGGWHFTAETYSLGGDMATQDSSGKWTAAFNNAKGKQVLQQLHDMRWTDNTMGAKQLLEYADLLTMMGSGKLGMYLAAPDNIPTIVNQYKGNFADYGLGGMPGDGGPAPAALGGGEGFMFNAKDNAAKIKAGLTWLTWEYANPDRIGFNYQRSAADKVPVGLPQPNLWAAGPAEDKWQAATKQYANVPQTNYTAFSKAATTIPLKVEPPNAQQIYAVLDTVMQGVLTNQNANIDQLLSTAETQVNTILSTVK